MNPIPADPLKRFKSVQSFRQMPQKSTFIRVFSVLASLSLASCATAPEQWHSQQQPTKQVVRPAQPNYPQPNYPQPNYPQPNYPQPNYQGNVQFLSPDAQLFQNWLQWESQRPFFVQEYRNFLSQFIPQNELPPMFELLKNARSWEKCGAEPFTIPPKNLWSNLVPTLQLYTSLKRQGILPAHTQIRSVYRYPELNQCAAGAKSSQHLNNNAIDIWVPEVEFDPIFRANLQDSMCNFWKTQGANYNLGLGLYATGAIHIDTYRYRRWGAGYSQAGSTCRD